MNVLFLSRWFPYPVDNGSKMRIVNLIKHLAVRFKVDLISFATHPVEAGHLAEMRNYCNMVEYVFYRPFQPARLPALLGFFAAQPRSVKDTYSYEMQRVVEEAVKGRNYDVVIASQLDMAPYALLASRVPKILEEIELTTLYERSLEPANQIEKMRRQLMWRKWAAYVSGLLDAFDAGTVVSGQERERLLQTKQTGNPLEVFPNGVDLDFYKGDFGLPQPDSLVFSGAITYAANFDAVEYFLREIYPLVRRRRPLVKFSITGRLEGAPVDRLPVQEGVTFTGYLNDVRPAVASSWVNVVPLRIGGGTRLKVLESLALGTPVVATQKGIEGLDLEDGRDYLSGEDPQSFAEAVLQVLESENLRNQLSVNGRLAVAAGYDWCDIGPSFCDFVETVIDRVREK